MTFTKRSVLLVTATALTLAAAPVVSAFQAPTKTKKAAATAKADAAAKVEVVGLSLEKAPAGQQAGPTIRFGQMITDGTSVTLLVTHPSKTIIGLDAKKSRLTSFADDKKANLLKAKPRSKNQGAVFNIGGDDGSPLKAENQPGGHSCLIKVVGPTLPAPGASKITLKGNLVLSCAASEMTVEHKNVALTNGTKINAGTIHMTVIAGPRGAGFALEMDQPLSAIKSIAFFDADGKELKSRSNGTSSYTVGNMTRTSQSYSLDKPVAKATIRVTYFDSESLSVPIDLTVGVGL